MDVAESPEWDPRSPEDEEEEQQGLSDDDILREGGSDQDLDKAAGKASDLENEENAVLGLSQEEEESRSDEENQDQDSEPQELNRGPRSPPHPEEGDGGEEDHTSDLRDEASLVTRELGEHELDYDEEVPEEPAPTGQEDEAEKSGAEEDEEQGEGAPQEEGKADVHSVEEKEPLEAAKENKKEDDDGEIDDGEIDDDDLEEGEVKDPSDRKVRPRPTCRFFMQDVQGNCTWGMNCRFIHPGVNDKGNYSLITKAEPFLPKGAPPLGPHPLMPAHPRGGPVVDEMLPPPPPEPPTESAWERGLRHAKEVLRKATIRKKQEPDFEEKRFTVTIGEDEREFDKENEVFRDWNDRITRDARDTPLEPYADPYYDYERDRFWRGRQYENFRVRYTATEPHQNDRERGRERERENSQRERGRARDKERLRREEEWERERARRAQKDRRHRHRDRDGEKEREKEKEKPRPRSPQPPSRQAEPEEAFSAGPRAKRAEEWKDPWRRSRSPKKNLGVSASPSRARRRRKTSASSASASHASRSSSRSSSASASGSSRSRSRSSSYSSCSTRSSGHSSSSGSPGSRAFSSSPSPSPTPSPHRPAVRAKRGPALPPGKAGEKMVKKPAPPQAPGTTAPAPAPAQPGGPGEAGRRESRARTPARRRPGRGRGRGRGRGSGSRSRSRSLGVSSVSSVSSATSSSSSVRSEGSDDMYADLASPVSPASSRPPTPAQAEREKAGKSKREDGVKEDQRKRGASTRPPKPSKSSAGRQSSQRAPSAQPPQGAWVAHKEIKLTLRNKAAEKGSRRRAEPSDKDRLSPPPAKRAHVPPDRGSRDRTSGGRGGSPQPGRQRGQDAKAPVALPARKRPLPPQSQSSSQVTRVPGKASDASTGTKSGKASALSKREELLRQLKAVEDAIARKQAKIPRKA